VCWHPMRPAAAVVRNSARVRAPLALSRFGILPGSSCVALLVAASRSHAEVPEGHSNFAARVDSLSSAGLQKQSSIQILIPSSLCSDGVEGARRGVLLRAVLECTDPGQHGGIEPPEERCPLNAPTQGDALRHDLQKPASTGWRPHSLGIVVVGRRGGCSRYDFSADR